MTPTLCSRRYNSQISYINCVKQEIEKHFQGLQLLTNVQIISHLKKLNSFSRNRNAVDELKRSLNLIYSYNKKLERMLSPLSQDLNQLTYISENQKEILPLLKPLFGENSDNLSSFPSTLLSNKNFIDSSGGIPTTNTKTCSDVGQQPCVRKDETNTITMNSLDNSITDNDNVSEADSDATMIPNDSNMDTSQCSSLIFNTGMLSNANFITTNSENICDDVIMDSQNSPKDKDIAKAFLTLPRVDQPSSCKKVFIFDSYSNVWKETEHHMSVDPSECLQNGIGPQKEYFQDTNTVTPDIFQKSDENVFKKPSNVSIKRKVSKSTLRKSYSENGQRGTIEASYSSGNNLLLTGRSGLSEEQKEISDTFGSLATGQNIVKTPTLSNQSLIINDTYKNQSGENCQSKTKKATSQVKLNEDSGTTQYYTEKGIISDSFKGSSHSKKLTNTHQNVLYEQYKREVKNGNFNSELLINENPLLAISTMDSNTDVAIAQKTLVYKNLTPSKRHTEEIFNNLPDINNNARYCEQSQIKSFNNAPGKENKSFDVSEKSGQLQKFRPDSKIMSCNNEIDDLSRTFGEVLVLGQRHNKNNIFKKLLGGVEEEDMGSTEDPKVTLDLARKLRGTFTLQYNQMVRKMSEDLVEDKNSWEDIEEAMRQPEQMLIQVESILPQVIQASSTERRLNAEAEFKEYLQNNPHNFGPEDLLELDPCRIFCDNEARIEEIASVFRQQLREEERSQYPDVELDIKEDFDEIVEMLAWRKIVEDVIRVD